MFGGVEMSRRDVSGFGKGEQVVRCLGSATVSPQDVIAYLGPDGDDRETFIDLETEYIIDPQRISWVTYKEITAPITTAFGP